MRKISKIIGIIIIIAFVINLFCVPVSLADALEDRDKELTPADLKDSNNNWLTWYQIAQNSGKERFSQIKSEGDSRKNELSRLYAVILSNVKKKDLDKYDTAKLTLYLECLNEFLKNTEKGIDPDYEVGFAIEAKERIEYIEKHFDLDEKQEEIKEDIKENIDNNNQESLNTVDQNRQEPTPTPRTPKTGNKKPDELASYHPEEKTSPDEIVDEGSDFIQTGKDNQGAVTIDGDKLRNGSNMLFNVAFATGVVVASVIGAYLGVKFMLSGAEEKANIKETLLPYFMGVIIMFSSFSIWKLVLVLLESIDRI